MKRKRPTFINIALFVFMVAANYLLVANATYLMAKFGIPDNALPYINSSLLILPPLLYYYLIVYRSNVRLRSVITFTALNLAASKFFVPMNMKTLLLFAVLIEIIFFIALLWRLIRMFREYLQLRNSGKSRIDATREIGAQLLKDILSNPIYRYVFIELSLFYYIVKNIRTGKPDSEGKFINNIKGQSDMVLVISLIAIMEIVPIHLLVTNYSHIAAWVVTILSLYSVLWFWGDYSALRLKHSYINDDLIHLKVGIRCSAVAPLEQIESYEFGEFTPEELTSKTFLNASLRKQGNLLIKFKQPVKATTMFGIQKHFTEIALRIVNVDDIRSALEPYLQTANMAID